MKSPAAATGSQCETTYLDCRWFSVWMSASFTPHLVVQFSSVQEKRQHGTRVVGEEKKMIKTDEDQRPGESWHKH